MANPALSAEEHRARGTYRADRHGPKAKKDRRPKAWDRERPDDSVLIDPADAAGILAEACGYDPRDDPAGCWLDGEAGLRAVRWIHEHCTHVKGRLGGQALILTPLQQAMIITLFGWKRESGFRRYQKALLYVARKFGKTLIAAAIALYMLLEVDDPNESFDYREAGVESYCAAAKRDQAKLLWGPAKTMIRNDEYLLDHLKLYQHAISRKDESGELDGSYFEAISAEANSAHGYGPQSAIIDELHAQPSAELMEVLDTGMAARDEPLALRVTTADFLRESVCNEEYDYACKVRDGKIHDPYYLPLIFEAAPDGDWTSVESIRRANPNYPVTPTKAYMQSALRKAKQSVRYQNTYKRLHLNLRTASDVLWFDISRWDSCAGTVDAKALTGRPCYAGLDISSVSDLTSLKLLFPEDGDRVLSYFWAPKGTADRRREKGLIPDYHAWAAEGHLTLCPRDSIDQEMIVAKILECAERYDLRKIAVDRWNAEWLIARLAQHDIEVVKFGQGFASMSTPSKELERRVLSNEIQHGGHPVLRWCAGNVMVETDNSPAENIKPVKAKTKHKARNQDDNKIDGIVALVMAIGVAMVDMEPTESVYETMEPMIL